MDIDLTLEMTVSITSERTFQSPWTHSATDIKVAIVEQRDFKGRIQHETAVLQFIKKLIEVVPPGYVAVPSLSPTCYMFESL